MTNQVTVLEPSKQTLDNLDRMKSIPPHLNLSSTELSKGGNSGIVFPQAGGNANLVGQFDTRITYLEEEDGQGGTEMVPYVQVYDSSNPTNGYAGYAYVGQKSYHILASALAPMAGYVYLYIDRISNIAEIRIASGVQDILGTVRKYTYPLAHITGNGTTTPWTVTRLNTPSVIHIPEDPRGAFDVDIQYLEESGTDPETGDETTVTNPYVLVYDSAGNNYSFAGHVYSGSHSYSISGARLTPMVGVVYLDVNYALNTRTISIAASLPSLSMSDRRWVYALANVRYNSSQRLYYVQRLNQPGNITVSGRWVD